MRLRKALAIMLCAGVTLSYVESANAGVIKAIVEKAKEKPDGLHAKIHAKKQELKLKMIKKKSMRKAAKKK